MKYLLVLPFIIFMGCSTFIKKEEPVQVRQATEVETPEVEKREDNPLVERVSIMISSFSTTGEMSLETKKNSDRSKLTFIIEQLENDKFLKLDFAIIPIKDIVRYKATVTLKRYKNKKEIERVAFEIATSNREEFIIQLKNMLNSK